MQPEGSAGPGLKTPVRRFHAVLLAAALALTPWSYVRAEDTPPPTVATDDDYPATEDEALFVPAPGLLANDNAATDTCAMVVPGPGLHGTVAVNIDGSFTYTPESNFNGPTFFTYGIKVAGDQACSGNPDSEATVTITVAPVNDAPTASADSFTVLKDKTLNVAPPGVLGNDNDVDGDTIRAVLDVNVTHGTLLLASSGAFAYTPAAGYTGPDGFSYHATDGPPTNASSPTRVVSLTVTAVPPINTPTPFPAPTLTPIQTPVETDAPSPSAESSASIDPSASPGETGAPTSSAAASPAASEAPGPVDAEGGVSLPVLLVIVLFVLLAGFGAALYVPKWLAAQRGEPPSDPLD